MRKLPLAALAFILGCTENLPLPESTIVACDAAGVCPTGLTCFNATRCVDPESIDDTGPELQYPQALAFVRDSESIVFTWKAVPNAIAYTFTVATDAQLTQPVANTPLVTSVNTATLTLPAGTYYWTVTSDISTTSQTPNLFSVIGDVIYVYCPADSDCDAGQDELGTLELPYRGLGRAMLRASLLGDVLVEVANRGDDVAYEEPLVVTDGVSVAGGYDPSFTTTGSPTRLISEGAPLVATRIRRPTVISNFELSNSNPRTKSSTIIRVFECTEALELYELRATGTSLVTPLITVEDGLDSIGPLLRDLVLSAAGGSEGDTTDLSVMSVSSALRLMDSEIYATSSATLGTLTGLEVAGLGTTSIANVTLTRTTIDVSGNGSTLTTRAVAFGNAALIVEGSTVRAHHGQGVSAIGATAFSTLRVVGSVVEATSAGHSASGVFNSYSAPTLVNNTLVIGNVSDGAADASAQGFYATGAPAIINNVVIAVAPLPSIARGVSFADKPASLMSNALIGWSCPFYKSSCNAVSTPDLATIQSANMDTTLAATGLTAYAGADSVAGTGDDVLAPVGGSLIGAGHNTTLCDCYTTCSGTTPNCGGSIPAADGGLRPQPPTIGAREPI